MQRQSIIIQHPLGFHARPVARWVSLAQTFQSDISLVSSFKCVGQCIFWLKNKEARSNVH